MGSSSQSLCAMELWATGFNAWGNVSFDEDDSGRKDWQDLPNFTRVLRDESIEVKAVYTSATLVKTPTGLRFSGYSTEYQDLLAKLGIEIRDAFWPTVAGHEVLAALRSGFIQQFEPVKDKSFADYGLEDGSPQPEEERECMTFDNFDDIVIDVVANCTSFTALTAAGTVYTWGDERIVGRLGRETSTECPADIPCIVEDLHSLPDKITKISSRGSLSAALTSEHDIYIWGTGVMIGPLNSLWSPKPHPLDLCGHDFLDVAVGNHHVIVLTTNHKIFVIGANRNGQLGLNDQRDHADWTEVTLPLSAQQQVTSVYAGYNNSLLLVEYAKGAEEVERLTEQRKRKRE